MIILFILSSLFLHVFAQPLRPLNPLQPLHPLHPLQPLHARFEIPPLTQRSVWNIIWSCLSTVFVCLWVVVHPNIPGPSDSMFFTRLKIMGCMLIAPELVIVWAGRQWFAARRIAADHRDQRWTNTHGFLASMGGFMLYAANGNMIKTLDIGTLDNHYDNERIEWPSVTKKQIEDRSKGDFLSKGIAVLQTTWFIAQCILRGVFNIHITQLELATLAFSALNIVLSILWMNKPLGVAYPFEVHLLPLELDPLHSPQNLSLNSPQDLNSPQSTFSRFLACFYIFLMPFNVAWSSMKDLIICDTLPHGPRANQFAVPTFYAPSTTNHDDKYAILIGLCVGILFGGIHCFAWSFPFPTPIELFIWRTSAVAITVIPFIFYLIVDNVRHGLETPVTSFHNFSTSLRILIIYFSIVLYILSRAALIVLPILSLRCLPPEALQDFEWTSFMPHI